MLWISFDPRVRPEEGLGYIPDLVSEDDPRPARQQFHDNYSHGGGWDPFKGFTKDADGQITYPGDPPLRPLFLAMLRDEEITVYPHAWVMITQPDGSWEISRMD